ncbi:MAG: B12-binding domain-containing radical SAM protein, partial [Acetobacteraceae bacterium]|nr:B12-binding domain-containing radical SAM protein [Acetobacteraceae bacterium]
MSRPDLLLASTPARIDYRYSALGPRYLAAVLKRAGFRVECVDGCLRRLSLADLARAILDLNPRVLGLSLLEPSGLRVPDLLADAGFSAPVVLGGHCPTFNAERLLQRWPQVTCMVRGEGELTLLELLPLLLEGSDIGGVTGVAVRSGDGVVVNPCRPLIADLDSLPFPDIEVLARDRHLVEGFALAGSRGCFGRCGFCSVQSFYALSSGRRWRCFSPGRVVDELEYLVRRFEAGKVWFLDDEFVGPKEAGRRWAAEVAEAILGRGLKLDITLSCRPDVVEEELFELLRRAGVTTVLLGVESGVQAQLDRYGKGATVEENITAILTLARLGIDARLGWIMLDPACTLDEYEANLNFLEAFDPRPVHRLTASLDWLSIYPGTPLEKSYCLPRGVPLEDGLTYAWEFEDPRLGELVRAARPCLDENRPRWDAIVKAHERSPREPGALESARAYAAEYFG